MKVYCGNTKIVAMNTREIYLTGISEHRLKQGKIKVSPAYVNCNIKTSLTPEICTKLVTEITKYIVSHKLIPFSYEALKRNATTGLTAEAECISRKSVQAKNNQRKIRDAYTTLESIFKNISDELHGSTTENAVQEVALVLGATAYSPREMYRILVPPLIYDKELRASQQTSQNRGLLQWFRCIVMSEEMNRLLSRTLTATNMYILLKRRVGKESEAFIPKDGYSLPRCVRQVVIDLTNSVPSSSDVEVNSAAAECTRAECQRDSVHKASVDSELSVDDMISNLHISCQDSCWFQSKLTFKGFKTNK